MKDQEPDLIAARQTAMEHGLRLVGRGLEARRPQKRCNSVGIPCQATPRPSSGSWTSRAALKRRWKPLAWA